MIRRGCADAHARGQRDKVRHHHVHPAGEYELRRVLCCRLQFATSTSSSCSDGRDVRGLLHSLQFGIWFLCNAHIVQSVVREEGLRGLYSGMSAHMLRVVPNSAIMFYTYELVVDFYKRRQEAEAALAKA
jgi:hypothetical protein